MTQYTCCIFISNPYSMMRVGPYVHMLEDLSRRGSGLAHMACVAGDSLAHAPSSLLGVPHRLKIRPIYIHGNIEALETRG